MSLLFFITISSTFWNVEKKFARWLNNKRIFRNIFFLQLHKKTIFHFPKYYSHIWNFLAFLKVLSQSYWMKNSAYKFYKCNVVYFACGCRSLLEIYCHLFQGLTFHSEGRSRRLLRNFCTKPPKHTMLKPRKTESWSVR